MIENKPTLFSEGELRSVRSRNRIVVSPMCQYMATEGLANQRHLVHYGQFALGGAGIIFVEATAVERRGRITHGCLGLWNDDQIAPLRAVADFIRANGGTPGIQLSHAGRKASSQKPWTRGEGLTEMDALEGEAPWPIIGPSPISANEFRDRPAEMSQSDLDEVAQAWKAAASRAFQAGFDVIEIHGAHGYLLHSFLSPLSNQRGDNYGGEKFEDRIRFPLQVVSAVRSAWPEHLPLVFRISATDGIPGGWELADSVRLSAELQKAGVDAVDCSSGGIDAGKSRSMSTALTRRPGFQVPFATRIRRDTGMLTMAVGLIVNPREADQVIVSGDADFVCLARELLYNPNWPLHAALELLGDSAGYKLWPQQYEWSLKKRAEWARRFRRENTELASPEMEFRTSEVER